MPRPKGAQEYKTARIWAVTLRKLKLVSALTGESMVEALERIVEAELQKVEHTAEMISKRLDARGL